MRTVKTEHKDCLAFLWIVCCLFSPTLHAETPSSLSPKTIQEAIEAKEWEKAESLAWEGAVTLPDQRTLYMGLWYEALMAQPGFLPEDVLTLNRKTHYTGLHLLSRQGTSYLFKVKKGRKTIAAFKPEQSITFSNHRGEVASYRLCSLIRCGFKVPVNQEVRIRKKHFDEIRTFDLEWEAKRQKKNITLEFRRDKKRRSWLYGTYKEWVPGYSQFPIATVKIWEKFLNIGEVSMEEIHSSTLEAILKRMKKLHPKRYRKFFKRAENVTPEGFLRQLSNLHVFDVLTSNWDRYSDDIPGVNCQWNHGVFVSIDNGASFPKTHKRKRDTWPFQRLKKYIQRYSRSTINAIRWMDTDRLYPILFPPSLASDEDPIRYELFLERRANLLAHVDALIAEHGADQVLVFD